MALEIKITLFLFLSVAAVWDCCKRKVPNALIGIVLLVGMLLYGRNSGRELLFYGIRCIGFGAPFVALFYVGALGGGDVKCIVIIGGLAGWQNGMGIVGTAMVMAASVASWKMVHYQIFQERMLVLKHYIVDTWRCGKVMPYPANRANQQITLPMSLFFFLGAVGYEILYFIFF